MSVGGLHGGVRGVELVQIWSLDWVIVCVREWGYECGKDVLDVLFIAMTRLSSWASDFGHINQFVGSVAEVTDLTPSTTAAVQSYEGKRRIRKSLLSLVKISEMGTSIDLLYIEFLFSSPPGTPTGQA